MNFDHRFYGSTSCCTRHWPCQWEMVMFDLPRLPDPLIDEIHNHPIIVLYMRLSGQIASFTHESFCPCFFYSRPEFASLDTSPRIIRHYTSFSPRKCLWGLERWDFNLTPFTSKRIKLGTFSWRSMENYSSAVCGMVSHIHFKLGTGVDRLSGITWHDFKFKGSEFKVTRSRLV